LSSEFTKILKKTFVLARPRAGGGGRARGLLRRWRKRWEVADFLGNRAARSQKGQKLSGALLARGAFKCKGACENLRGSVLERAAAVDELA